MYMYNTVLQVQWSTLYRYVTSKAHVVTLMANFLCSVMWDFIFMAANCLPEMSVIALVW